MDAARLHSSRTGHDPEFASAREAIEAFVQAGWHEEVRRRLAARYERTRGSEAVEEAVGHALEKAIGGLRGRNGRQVYSFILTAAERRLLDGAKRDKRAEAHGWAPSAGDGSIAAVADTGTESIEDAWADRDARALAQEASLVIFDLLERRNGLSLPDRTLEVLRLFHLEGLTKRKIRHRTGLTEKQLRTSLAEGNRVLHDQFVAVAARLERDCSSSRQAVLRFAFDLAQGREAARARAHLGHCLACARQVRHARAFRRHAVALFPLPAAQLPHLNEGVHAWIARLARAGGQRSGPAGVRRLAKLAAVCLAGGAVAGVWIATGPGGPDRPSPSVGATDRARTGSPPARHAAPPPDPRPSVERRPAVATRTARKAAAAPTATAPAAPASTSSTTSGSPSAPPPPPAATPSSRPAPAADSSRPEFPIF